MLFNKMFRIIWGILFIVCLLNIMFFNNDRTIRYIFGITSAVIFILDFIKSNNSKPKFTFSFLKTKKWHMFANFTQWLFWVMLLYIPFRSELGLGYKIFLIGDLFFVATFAFYKFVKTLEK